MSSTHVSIFPLLAATDSPNNAGNKMDLCSSDERSRGCPRERWSCCCFPDGLAAAFRGHVVSTTLSFPPEMQVFAGSIRNFSSGTSSPIGANRCRRNGRINTPYMAAHGIHFISDSCDNRIPLSKSEIYRWGNHCLDMSLVCWLLLRLSLAILGR